MNLAMTRTETKSRRNWVVVCNTLKGAPVYVGELDCGRQGVRKLENATRFTKIGAQRVCSGYPDAIAEGRAWIKEVVS